MMRPRLPPPSATVSIDGSSLDDIATPFDIQHSHVGPLPGHFDFHSHSPVSSIHAHFSSRTFDDSTRFQAASSVRECISLVDTTHESFYSAQTDSSNVLSADTTDTCTYRHDEPPNLLSPRWTGGQPTRNSFVEIIQYGDQHTYLGIEPISIGPLPSDVSISSSMPTCQSTYAVTALCDHDNHELHHGAAYMATDHQMSLYRSPSATTRQSRSSVPSAYLGDNCSSPNLFMGSLVSPQFNTAQSISYRRDDADVYVTETPYGRGPHSHPGALEEYAGPQADSLFVESHLGSVTLDQTYSVTHPQATDSCPSATRLMNARGISARPDTGSPSEYHHPSQSYVYPSSRNLSACINPESPHIIAPQPKMPNAMQVNAHFYDESIDHPSYQVLSIPNVQPTTAAPVSAVAEDTAKKPLTLACFFCRKRKIACGSPPPGRIDRTCNQCARRNLKCVYPEGSRRGMRPKLPYEKDHFSMPTIPVIVS